MDAFQQLLETTFIGTPIPIPLEVRVHEVSFDPAADEFRLKWKVASSVDPGAFDEPPEGERKRYLNGDLVLSRDAFSAADSLSFLKLEIAEWTARDVAEFMVIGANKALGK